MYKKRCLFLAFLLVLQSTLFSTNVFANVSTQDVTRSVQSIYFDIPVSNTLSDENYEALYTFTLDRERIVEFELTPNSLWYPYIYLYAADGYTEIHSEHSWNLGYSVSFVQALPAGVYFIKIANWSGYGGYSVRIHDQTANLPYNEVEPNDTMSQAQTLLLNSTIQGIAGPGGHDDRRKDWFKLRLEREMLVDFTLSLGNSSGSYYFGLYLDNTEIYYTHTFSGQTIECSQALGAGTYYVYLYCNGSPSSYSLTAAANDQVAYNELEPNNSTYQAMKYTLDTLVNGFVFSSENSGYNPDYYDWYTIDLEREGVVDFRVIPQHNMTPQIELFASDGMTSLAFSRSYSTGSTVMLTEFLGKGTFYIRITSTYASGAYRFIANQRKPTFGNDIEPNNSIREAAAVSLNKPISGFLHAYGVQKYDDTDFYKLTVDEDGLYEFATASTDYYAIQIKVYKSDGVTSVNEFTVYDTLISQHITLNRGTYYIEISSISNFSAVEYYMYIQQRDVYRVMASSNFPTKEALTQLNTTVNGELGNVDSDYLYYVKWYTFDITDDGYINVDISSKDALETMLALYTAEGILVGKGSSLRIPILYPGSYEVKVSRIAGEGVYNLTMSFDSFRAGDEPNNDQSTANLIKLGDHIEGHLGAYYQGNRSFDLTDVYVVDVAKDGYIYAEITQNNLVVDKLTLSSGWVIRDASYIQNNGLAFKQYVYAGRYYIHVESYGNASGRSGYYTLQTKFSETDTFTITPSNTIEYDKDNSFQTTAVKSVSLKADTTLTVGQIEYLLAAISPSDATNRAVTWSSHAPQVASVDENGKIIALQEGTTFIKVTTKDGGYTVHCKVDVVSAKIPVESVQLDQEPVILWGENETVQLYAKVTPSNATNPRITWATSNSNVATVDSNGVVTSRGIGYAIISVQTEEGGFQAACDVIVNEKEPEIIPVIGVQLNIAAITLDKNDSLQLMATTLPADATNQNVTWRSDNSTVAIVDSNGFVTAMDKGEAIITVETEDGYYQATCHITVKEPIAYVTGVSLDTTSLTLYKDDSLQLTATVFPANAANKNVIWATSDSTVATVDLYGMVTAKRRGTAVITVQTEDGYFQATCEITVQESSSDVTFVTGVALNIASASVDKEDSIRLTATVFPATATDKEVHWLSSNEMVATVVDGVVYGNSKGVATITVITMDGAFEATCTVTVTDPNILTPVISVFSANGRTGEEVEVKVNIRDNPGIAAFALQMHYDNTKLEPLSVLKGNVMGTGIFATNLQSGEDITDFLKIFWSNSTNVTKNGYLFTVTFRIKNNIDPCEVPLTLTYSQGDIVDQNHELVDTLLEPGVLSIASFLAGDINEDGRINPQDSVLLMQYLAGWFMVLTPNQQKAADVFPDTVLNSKDGIRLAQYLAGWNVSLGR